MKTFSSRCRACSVALAGLLAATALPAAAQTNYSQVHVFGDATTMAGGPYDNVVIGSDGALYGTTSAGGLYGSGAVFKMNADGTGFSVLYSFGVTVLDGSFPHATVVQGTNGALYGTTYQGGTNHPGTFYSGAGTLFKIGTNGTGYAVLHHFGGTNDGIDPQEALIRGTDGALYGTTGRGGSNTTFGTVFTVNEDGSGYAVLHSFGGAGDGKFVFSSLTEGSDHALYGVTSQGGTNGSGTVFKMNKDGTGYVVLHHFGSTGDGASPQAKLIEGTDLALYGTTTSGGTNGGGGTVFKINKDGSGYTVLWNFSTTDGNGLYIYSGVIEGADHKLYGAASITSFGSYSGNVYSLNKDGTGFTIIHTFSGAQDSQASPTASLLQSANGTLYGSTRTGGLPFQGTVFKLNTDGGGYSVLWSFSASSGDGSLPESGLIRVSDGTLYGTTDQGGTNSQGSVFKFSQDGTGYKLVFSFGSDTNGGTLPYGGLIQASDTNLYGTTVAGAAPGQGNQGTVYKLNLDGSGHTVLHSFGVLLNDGYNPQARLVEGSDGRLYGTTGSGGSNGYYGGVLFGLSKTGGNYLVVHQFGGTNDGVTPSGALLEGSDHVLYGLTSSGGSHGGSFSGGTVFKLNKDGTGYSIVYNFFSGAGDGYNPRALIEGSDGALYGITGGGGTNAGAFGSGTVFKINKDGSGYSILYNFGALGDGSVPNSLIEGSGGALYGLTAAGGAGSGTAFKLNKDGSGYAILYKFGTPATDGKTPTAGLALGSNGELFGTTSAGGFNLGTVFELSGSVAQQTNHPPVVANPIPNQIAAYGSPFSYTFPTNTFTDPDAGQTLSYGAANLPSGISFTAATRTFAGSSTQPGVYAVSVTATDNGAPPLSTNTVFTLTVTASPIIVSPAGGGGVHLTFTGVPLASYQVQATDTLAPPNWQVIATLSAAGNGLFGFTDTNAPSHPTRFYRTLGQ